MDTTAVISFSLVPIVTKCWYVQRLLKHAWTIAVLSSTQSTAACNANDPKTLVLEVFLWSNIHYRPESHLFCLSFCQFFYGQKCPFHMAKHHRISEMVFASGENESWSNLYSETVIGVAEYHAAVDLFWLEAARNSCNGIFWANCQRCKAANLELEVELVEGWGWLNSIFWTPIFWLIQTQSPCISWLDFWQRCRQEKEQLEAWFSDSWKSSNLFGSPLLGQYVTNQSWRI